MERELKLQHYNQRQYIGADFIGDVLKEINLQNWDIVSISTYRVNEIMIDVFYYDKETSHAKDNADKKGG